MVCFPEFTALEGALREGLALHGPSGGEILYPLRRLRGLEDLGLPHDLLNGPVLARLAVDQTLYHDVADLLGMPPDLRRSGYEREMRADRLLEAHVQGVVRGDRADAVERALGREKNYLRAGQFEKAEHQLMLIRIVMIPGGLWPPNFAAMEVEVARGYAKAQGLPPVSLREFEDNRFQDVLRDVINKRYTKVVPRAPLELPLSWVIPFHRLSAKRKGAGESLDESIQTIRSVMAVRLAAFGWKRGEMPDATHLINALVDNNNSLPIVSAISRSGYRLLLDGHHRVFALVSLVADGWLPRQVLQEVPFYFANFVDPLSALAEARRRSGLDRVPDFSWGVITESHPPSQQLMREIGATALLPSLLV